MSFDVVYYLSLYKTTNLERKSMSTLINDVIESFQALRVELDNAEKRIRQVELKKTEESNAMVFIIPCEYIPEGKQLTRITKKKLKTNHSEFT